MDVDSDMGVSVKFGLPLRNVNYVTMIWIYSK